MFFFQVKQQLMKMDLLHRLKQFYQMYQRIRTEGLAKINFFFNLVLSLFDWCMSAWHQNVNVLVQAVFWSHDLFLWNLMGFPFSKNNFLKIYNYNVLYCIDRFSHLFYSFNLECCCKNKNLYILHVYVVICYIYNFYKILSQIF